MITLFTENITPRLSYIATTLFGESIIITDDETNFNSFLGKKINYSSKENIPSDLWITPVTLLQEINIKPQQNECFFWEDLQVFFKTSGTIPFDIFAASFYLITRYEEYNVDYEKDDYGNYHHKNSLAYQENFLKIPLINLWIQKIENIFQLNIQHSTFKIIPTYDIDIAFAYKHHPLYIQVGGILKDIIHFRKSVLDRVLGLLGLKKDPYDLYEWLNELHEKYHLNAIYFFLVAKERSQFDKNSSRKKIKSLIQKIYSQNQIGIHPSFKSNSEKGLLKNEIEYLEEIINRNINKSRQHYLQLKFPITYRSLIQEGITNDYTLGYGTHNGFRTSYCKPFFWYDLENEKKTELVIHPFCFMDANSIFEQNLNTDEALSEMKYYYEQVKSVNGEFSFIMHNHFLTEQEKWKDWRKTYTNFLQQINDLQ